MSDPAASVELLVTDGEPWRSRRPLSQRTVSPDFQARARPEEGDRRSRRGAGGVVPKRPAGGRERDRWTGECGAVQHYGARMLTLLKDAA